LHQIGWKRRVGSNVVVGKLVEFLLAGDFQVGVPRYVYDIVGGVEEVVGGLVEKLSGTLVHIEFDGNGSSAWVFHHL
jgi:hypothetical protein